MSRERFIMVVGRLDEREVRAYLYGHTTILAQGADPTHPERRGYLLVTVADTDERADYLATYQANRFASGLYAAATTRHLHKAVEQLSGYGVTLRLCDAEFGPDHEHDDKECARILANMQPAPYNAYDPPYDETGQRSS
jgi:hypothetical protein